MLSRPLEVAASFASSVARFGTGMAVAGAGRRPVQTLILYEFESCPYCRKVREALSILDLDAEIRPCPHGGTRFRPEVQQRGGKQQYPFLVDPNTGRAMYESDDIVRYLFTEYGDGTVPAALALGPLTLASSGLASLARLGHGVNARRGRAPAQPLELWSFEASPFCRLVRERLSELEIPYLLHNVAKGSPKREAFVARAGKMQVPWLFDPNTGQGMYESADIVRHLDATYG